MSKTLHAIACALPVLILPALPALTQTAGTGANEFTPENAILDTSVPLAIGAREARQELRGSFGWATFQEGLVDGVYFRFDPDGYARFAPTPRLDSDVFEVICRPRTYSCLARKGALSAVLNSRGQLQLEIDGALADDRFFIVEGVSELEVPGRILQPLDQHLEALLSAGGELVARRGAGNETGRVSLTGFSAVTAYLRWVSARQDYTVLPRGWPVPNAVPVGGVSGLTQSADWRVSRPLPQNQPILAGTDPQATAAPPLDVAAIREELATLRQLLLDRTAPPSPADPALPAHWPVADVGGQGVPDPFGQAARRVLQDTEALKVPQMILTDPERAPTPAQGYDAGRIAAQLEYLMTEIGLDPQTAVMLVQLGATQQAGPVAGIAALPVIGGGGHQADAVADILADLQEQLAVADPGRTEPFAPEAPEQLASETAESPVPGSEDYLLLSEYFRSVFADQAGHAEAASE